MSMCEGFAKCCAITSGLTYAQARKLYPRGCDSRTVYLSEWEASPRDHCVHCARANALMKYGARGKYEKYFPLTEKEMERAERKAKENHGELGE